MGDWKEGGGDARCRSGKGIDVWRGELGNLP